MDPRRNPYAPGAGNPPPELAGRDRLIERAAIAIDRTRARLPARSFIFYGLRGVGKTVLLNRIRLESEARGIAAVRLEAPEERSLPAILAPALRSMLLRLNRGEAMKGAALRAMKMLAGFAKALKVSFNDIEVSIGVEPEPGAADSGDLDQDLTDLLASVGMAAAERHTACALFIDELQYVPAEQLAALITALHHAAQAQLPITLLGAGLPQLMAQSGHAKSYAERLFEFVPIDRLDEIAATAALTVPASRESIDYERQAIEIILARTQGYPYFLQEWGKHCWDIADGSPITRAHAEIATVNALAELDASFFRVRFDRLTPAERNYVQAMAELGAGPHRSGDVAEALGRKVSSVAPIRNSLIAKGMLYSPAHGDTAFTVPLFDGFVKRVMPL